MNMTSCLCTCTSYMSALNVHRETSVLLPNTRQRNCQNNLFMVDADDVHAHCQFVLPSPLFVK